MATTNIGQHPLHASKTAKVRICELLVFLPYLWMYVLDSKNHHVTISHDECKIELGTRTQYIPELQIQSIVTTSKDRSAYHATVSRQLQYLHAP